MALAAAFGLERIARGEARGAAQPAGQHGLFAQVSGLARQDDEHGLRDFLGQMRVAHLPQRGGIDQRHVAFHQRRKRLFRVLRRVSGKQFGIIRQAHLLSNVHWRRNPTVFFESRGKFVKQFNRRDAGGGEKSQRDFIH